jgi:hypothetical protein
MATGDDPQFGEYGPIIIKLQGDLDAQQAVLDEAIGRSAGDSAERVLEVTLTENNLAELAPTLEAALDEGIPIRLHRER